MNIVILYHADCTDGYASAYCAWLKFGESARYIALAHGDMKDACDFDSLGLTRDTELFLLDIVPDSLALLETLKASVAKLTILDHHASAFHVITQGAIPYTPTTRVDLQPYGFNGVLDASKSSAILAWQLFQPSIELPRLLAYVDDYDRGQFELPFSKQLNVALQRRKPWSFPLWSKLVADSGAMAAFVPAAHLQLLEEGKALYALHELKLQSILQQCQVITVDGHRALAVNCPFIYTNDAGWTLAHKAEVGLAWFVQHNGLVKCSLRSKGNVDVSRVAKRYGGGGHPYSAAFEIPLLQFAATILGST